MSEPEQETVEQRTDQQLPDHLPEVKAQHASDQSTNAPLIGWRILVTRARPQAAELITRLQEYGATVLECPTIAIAPPTTWQQLDAALTQLHTYDWLIFTSANAVDYFFSRYQQQSQQPAWPVHLKVAVVGQTTAARLQQHNIRVDLCPQQQNGTGLLAALQANSHTGVAGQRFLLPRARHGRDELPDGLRQSGAVVDVVETYQTIRPETDQNLLLTQLRQRLDAVIFASPSAVRNLVELLDAATAELLFEQTLALCIGSTTRASAAQHGFRLTCEASQPAVTALIQELLSYNRSSL